VSAIEALKKARAAGVRVDIDGNDLVLQAPVPPPANVIDLLSKNKSGIVALLQPAAAVLASWRTEIERVVPASPPIKRLKQASLEFLAGPHAMAAVQSGWCELSLFGIFDGNAKAARNRLGARGLLPTLAWSTLQLRLEDINREHATLVTSTSAAQRQRRFQSEIELSTAWWRNRALLDEAAPDETFNHKGYIDEGY
jgi:hypothetical protein